MLIVPILTQSRVEGYDVPLQKKATKAKRSDITHWRQQGRHSKPGWTPNSSDVTVLPACLCNTQNGAKFPPFDTMLLTRLCQEKSSRLLPNQPHLGPKASLQPCSSQRGVKKVSFWVQKNRSRWSRLPFALNPTRRQSTEDR